VVSDLGKPALACGSVDAGASSSRKPDDGSRFRSLIYCSLWCHRLVGLLNLHRERKCVFFLQQFVGSCNLRKKCQARRLEFCNQ
jgi:hypothetical protein